jgi:hypothetical protein
MLERFARTELGSSSIMRWAAAATASPARRAAYLRHALDEERHARLFAARARKLGGSPGPLVADADDVFRLLGERRFVAFVHRAEARGAREFEAYERAFRARGDTKTASVFALVLRDERRHVEYSKGLIAELAVGRETLVWVASWEAVRAARRSARAVLGALHGLVMFALYAAVLPFWLVTRLRSRRARARARAVEARGVALLER